MNAENKYFMILPTFSPSQSGTGWGYAPYQQPRPKILTRSDLTMTRGSSRTSWVGIVSSRIASSPSSSSASGTKGKVERWAIMWMWDALLSARNMSAGGSLLTTACSSSRFTCCLPTGWHFTWDGKEWLKFIFWAQQSPPTYVWNVVLRPMNDSGSSATSRYQSQSCWWEKFSSYLWWGAGWGIWVTISLLIWV